MSLKQNLTDYINKEIEYGKPSSADYFIRTDLAHEIKNNPTLLANDELEKYINDYWKKTVYENPDAVFCGGYDFYRYLSEQQITNDNFKEIIENYDVPELYKTGLNDISLNNCDTIYEILQANEKDIHYMLIRNGHIRILKGYNTELLDTVDSSIENRIKELRYEQKYLGTKINKFVNIPKTEFAKIGLWQIEQELLFKHKNDVINTRNVIDGTSSESINSENAEQAESSYNSFNSNTSEVAEKSIEADKLSEDGVQQVTEEFIRKILNERQDVIGEIESRIEKHRQEIEEYQRSLYEPKEYNGEYSTKDIYSDEIINDARRLLRENHRLLILGSSGDGKTELAYMLAHELTGEPIGKPVESGDCYYKRICIESARTADSLVGEGLRRNGLLDRFIKYIKDNNILEPCVLICNEVQASDMGYLLGNTLWESFSVSVYEQNKILPDNLYLLFTGCIDRDFGIDTQIEERIKPVKINYISKNNKDVHNKILREFKGDNTEKILDIVEKINDYEEYQVVSMRQFIRVLNGNEITITNKDILHEQTKSKLEMLEMYYAKA